MALFYALYKIKLEEKRKKKKKKRVGGWVKRVYREPYSITENNNNNNNNTTTTIIIISSTYCTRALDTCTKNITTDTHRRIF